MFNKEWKRPSTDVRLALGGGMFKTILDSTASIRRSLPFVSSAMLVLCVSGCAGNQNLLSPPLSPNNELVKNFEGSPTLTNAIEIGEDLRKKYSREVDGQLATDKGASLLLIGAAASAAGLGALSIAPNVILGLSLGSAAVYSGGTMLSNKPQQMIFSLGASAVQCAVNAYGPMQAVYDERAQLEGLLAGEGADTPALNVLISRVKELLAGYENPKNPTLTALTDRANAAVAAGDAAKSAGRTALATLDRAGTDLHRKLIQIEAQVREAVVRSSPDISSVAAGLGDALLKRGPAITGVPIPEFQKSTKPLATKGIAEEDLTKRVEDLEARVAQIEQFVARVDAAEPKGLENCAFKLDSTGVGMTLLPTGEILLDGSKAGSAATVKVVGGTPPYDAGWIGAKPPKTKLALTVDQLAGTATVEVKSALAGAKYSLYLKDNANHIQTAVIGVSGSSPSSPGSSSSNECVVSEDWKKIQRALITKGFKEVEIEEQGTKEKRTLKADGCYGPITYEAARKYLISKGLKPTDITPYGDDGRGKDLRDMLKQYENDLFG